MEHGIPYVILKGCASASYYPYPFDCALEDVDFIVGKENFKIAEKYWKQKDIVDWSRSIYAMLNI